MSSRGPGRRRAYDEGLAERGARLAWRVEEPVPFCWMCDASGGQRAKEHVFPQWLLAMLDAASELFNPVHRDYFGRVVGARGPVPASALVAGEVCATCNGGWMSDLEARAKPLLFPSTSRKRLDQPDQAVVARWLAKIAVVLNTSQNYRLMVPRAARHALAFGLPDDFGVFLARHHQRDGGQLGFGQTTGALGIAPPEQLDEMRQIIERTWVCGLAIGDVLEVVADTPPGGWATPTEPMVRIWPPGPPVEWAQLPEVEEMESAMILSGRLPEID